MFIPDALAVELRAAVVKVGALVEPWESCAATWTWREFRPASRV